jgi:hypothetical protein
MSWSYRRSIRIGPLRFNLSKSGIGASAGIPGFRVGKDAKGRSYSQVSIPGTGIYRRDYYKTNPTATNAQSTPGTLTAPNQASISNPSTSNQSMSQGSKYLIFLCVLAGLGRVIN